VKSDFEIALEDVEEWKAACRKAEAERIQLLIALRSATKLLSLTLEWNWAESPAPFYGQIEEWMKKYTVSVKAPYDGVDDSMPVWDECFGENKTCP